MRWRRVISGIIFGVSVWRNLTAVDRSFPLGRWLPLVRFHSTTLQDFSSFNPFRQNGSFYIVSVTDFCHHRIADFVQGRFRRGELVFRCRARWSGVVGRISSGMKGQDENRRPLHSPSRRLEHMEGRPLTLSKSPSQRPSSKSAGQPRLAERPSSLPLPRPRR